MGLLTLALTIFGTGADVLSIGQFIAASMKEDGQTADELFAACFIRAVNRHRHKLGKLTETGTCESVQIDDLRLEASVKAAAAYVLPKVLPHDRDSVVQALSPVFRDVIILPGSQLTESQLDQHLATLLDDSFADFFVKLPAHPTAVAEATLQHIARANAADAQQSQALADIRAQLAKVLAKQDDIAKRSSYLDPAVLQQESTRPEYGNPFRIVKAEDFNHDYDRLASLFREPSIYDDLRGTDNLIIAGGRGCGKSMLLRSLSALTAIHIKRLKEQQRAGQNTANVGWKDAGLNYFGVYIKLARGYFYDWSPDCKLTPDAATHLFQHIFNMILLRSLLEGLVEAHDEGVLKIEPHIEQSIVQQICDFAGFTVTAPTLSLLIAHTRWQERQVGDFVGTLRLGISVPQYNGAHTAIHDFPDHCCKVVIKAIAELSDSRIFFLLDEYENLAEFQQRVVNTLAKLRPLSLSLKVAARALGVKSVVDLQGEPIQRPRDYHVVELDYDPSDARYRQLLFDIATKRLEAEGFTDSDIHRLLPIAPKYHPTSETEVLEAVPGVLKDHSKKFDQLSRVEQNEKLHQWSVALVFRLSKDRRQPFTYAGFDDFADLSSGIISTFLEFCKLAFYLAQADGVDVRSGKPIPWATQNEAVYIASRAYFDYIERNIPDTGAAISRLVLDLADIFREKLLHHGSEPESARLIIKDPGAFEAAEYRHLGGVLDDAVRWSVLHARGQANAYFPKHKTEVRSNDYLLNRVLAPILRISPRSRWRCIFTTQDIAKLVDQQTRKDARNELRQKQCSTNRGDNRDQDTLPLFSPQDEK